MPGDVWLTSGAKGTAGEFETNTDEYSFDDSWNFESCDVIKMSPDKFTGDQFYMDHVTYCKFGNFRENLIFTNSIKRHICDVKNWRPGHDLPISVNDRVISPYRERFIFTKLRICEVSPK